MRRQRKIIEDEELEKEEESNLKQNTPQQIEKVQKDNSNTNENTKNCPVCYECMKQVVFLECLHKFCFQCIKGLVKHEQKLQCPLCRQNFQEYNVYNRLENGKLDWNKTVKIGASQILQSQEISSSQQSYDFQSASSIQECQQCFCCDDLDDMIRCYNCRRIIGHVYCFPHLVDSQPSCQQCHDL